MTRWGARRCAVGAGVVELREASAVRGAAEDDAGGADEVDLDDVTGADLDVAVVGVDDAVGARVFVKGADVEVVVDGGTARAAAVEVDGAPDLEEGHPVGVAHRPPRKGAALAEAVGGADEEGARSDRRQGRRSPVVDDEAQHALAFVVEVAVVVGEVDLGRAAAERRGGDDEAPLRCGAASPSTRVSSSPQPRSTSPRGAPQPALPTMPRTMAFTTTTTSLMVPCGRARPPRS